MAKSNSPLNDIPGRQTVAVPPGRSLADMPPREPIPPPSGAAKPQNSRLTLRQHIIGEGEKGYLIDLLLDLGKTKKTGPWRDYLEFYRANLSGDYDSFKPADKAKCDKMKKDLENAFFESQEL